MPRYPDRRGFYDYPFSKHETMSGTYEVAHTFPFQGSDNVGPMVSAKVVGGKIDSEPTYDIRLYDATNAKVIAEAAGGSSSYPEILDLGAIANVPTEAAVFEVQIRRASGPSGKRVAVASIYLEF